MKSLAQLQAHVAALNFRDAFLDVLKWNHSTARPFERVHQDRAFVFAPLAETGGFDVFEVTEANPPDGAEPLTGNGSRSLRAALDTKVAGVSHSHILIFVDKSRGEAVFLVARVRDGKRYIRERPYRPGLPIAPLVAFLGEFAIPYEMLDPTGELPHTKMLDLLDAGSATAEKVSKKFYDDLATKRKAFEPFLKWIADEEKRAWYVTALLNRLMFIYFVQQKQLVNHDPHYLRHLLEKSEGTGKDRFYRDYFLPLCFFGFGKPPGGRGQYESLFADVVYLNGGLFSVHIVETEAGVSPEAVAEGSMAATLNIPDGEFRKWFDFFDSWRWTLDEDNPDNDGEINPGILGYIFEKYVNQKQMGAYYTKEDITGYICRNTVVPRLFDMLAEAGDKGARSVEPLPIGPQPNPLNNGLGISDGEGIERYIYAAVKTTDTLPTETTREYAARQARFEGILRDFEDGKIRSVNDFITYNLDIEKMAADFVARIQDAQVLHDLYFRCLTKITVLDPTCGSGAFLFAALKVLSPLYDGCLRRMEHFCHGNTKEPAGTLTGEFAYINDVAPQPALLDPGTVTDPVADAFAAELKRIGEHPRTYYITKSIIVNNLYGVDIMDEAVEICKLRLFLKLAAQATPDPAKKNQGIEPLPDIDFNILAGNTLVGYAHIADIDRLWASVERGSTTQTGAMAFAKDHSRLKDQLAEYAIMLRWYRDEQLGVPISRKEPVTKEMVRAAADQARPGLDEDLWRLHRTAGKYPEPDRKHTLETFQQSHRPFHWLLEFPNVEATGGFDVVVGNPPYVEFTKKDPKTGKSPRDLYRLVGFATESCGNLYGFVLERASRISPASGRLGMIVPVSLLGGDGYACVVHQVIRAASWISSFSNRPGKLFAGVEQRLAIVISAGGSKCDYVSDYSHWYEPERAVLFDSLAYGPVCLYDGLGRPPKVGSTVGQAILEKLLHHAGDLFRQSPASGVASCWVHDGPTYWIRALTFDPHKGSAPSNSNHYRCLPAIDEDAALVMSSILSSSLFYLHFKAWSNCRDLGTKELHSFPWDGLTDSDRPSLIACGLELRTTLIDTAQICSRRYPSGTVHYREYYPARAKPIIDEIDRVLAKHYGFTDEELDFIINYDIKYRMGAGGGEAE